MQPVHAGDQVKEGGGWVGRQIIARGVELSPCHELPDQESEGENARCEQAGSYASIFPRRAAVCAHCSAPLLKISSAGVEP